MAASAAVARAEVALPVEYCQVRPGRMLAVHRRVHPRATHTLFFVHGSCGSLLQWQAQLDHSSRFSSVLAYDSYGCGRSPKPHEWEAYTSHALIADLVALVQRFSASSSSEKLVLVAHSAAAGFALQAVRWLSEAPGEGRRQIAGVVTVSALDAVPSALALFRLPLCVLTRLQPSLSAGFVEGALHEETRAARTEEHQELLSLCDGINEANPMYMCQAYYRQLLTPSDEEIAAVRVPVMLIAGEADKIVPPAASLRWAAILGARHEPSELFISQLLDALHLRRVLLQDPSGRCCTFFLLALTKSCKNSLLRSTGYSIDSWTPFDTTCFSSTTNSKHSSASRYMCRGLQRCSN